MRKALCVLLAFLLSAVLLAGGVFAQSLTDTSTPQTEVNVGYINGSDHMSFTDENGVGKNYFDEIEKHVDFSFNHIAVSPQEGLVMLESGEIDFLGPVSVSDSYISENFLATNAPLSSVELVIVASIGSGVAYNDFDAMENLTIGVDDYGEYYVHEARLNGFAAQNNVDFNLTLTEYEDNVKWQTTSGKYSLRLMEYARTTGDMELVANIGQEPMYYITRKDNMEMLALVNEGIDKIALEDVTFSQRLQVEYMEDRQLAKPNFTVQQKQLLEQKGVITVNYSSNTPPLEYTAQSGEPDGILVEILDLLAYDMGVELQYVEIDGVVSQSFESDLSLSIHNQHSSQSNYSKTDPYLALALSMISKRVDVDEGYNNAGALSYFDVDFSESLKPYGSYIITYYNDMQVLIDILSAGGIDYLVTPTVSVEYILSNLDKEDCSTYQLSYEMPVSFYVSDSLENKEQFIEIFNIAIERLSAEDVENIVAKGSVEYNGEQTLADFLADNLAIIISVITVIISMFFIVVWKLNARRERDLKNILNVDECTQLATKYCFFSNVNKILADAKPAEYSIMSLDIDDFKIVNELFGYTKGNEVLKVLAQSLIDNIDERAIIARESNDNFLIFVPTKNNNQKMGAAPKSDMLFRIALRQVIGDDYSLHVSVGRFVIQDPSMDIDYMIDCANYARLIAKSGFGSTLVDFTQQMMQERVMKNEIVSTMETALFSGEFEVFYQPKIDLETRKIVGAEALVRWFRDGKPLFFPDQFIPLFESNRFVIRLDYHVLQSVCRFIKQNYDIVKGHKISVNLSGFTLLDDELITTLLKTVRTNGIQTSDLELEITEGVFIESFESSVTAIKKLSEIGFTISMDDFGSGLSSYNRLKDIPIDVLKLDKEFCMFRLDDLKGVTIVESIVTLAKNLDLAVIAEGVEHRDQADLLDSIGCDGAQGYHFSRPVPSGDFLKMLVEQKNKEEEAEAEVEAEVLAEAEEEDEDKLPKTKEDDANAIAVDDELYTRL